MEQIKNIFPSSATTLSQAFKRLEDACKQALETLSEERVCEILLKAERALEVEIGIKKWRDKISQEKEVIPLNSTMFVGYFYEQYPKLFGTLSMSKTYGNILLKIAYILLNANTENKGVLLYGGTGVGKTSTMKCFAVVLSLIQNENYPTFKTVNAIEISNDFSSNGIQALNKYSRPVNEGLIRNGGWFFDDIGAEREGSNYGNKLNTIEQLIQLISNRSEMKGKVHMSTNLGELDLKERYGERVFSRMCELFTFISFPADSRDMRINK